MKFAIIASCTLASSAVALVARVNPQTAASILNHHDEKWGYTPCDKPGSDPFDNATSVTGCGFRMKKTRQVMDIMYTNDFFGQGFTPIDPTEMQFLIGNASKWAHEQQELSHASDDDGLPLANATSNLDPTGDYHRAGLNFRSGDAAIRFAYLPCEAKDSSWDSKHKVPTYRMYQQFLQNFFTLYDTLVIKDNHRDLVAGTGSLTKGSLSMVTEYFWYKVSNVQDGFYDVAMGNEQCPNEKVIESPETTLPAAAA